MRKFAYLLLGLLGSVGLVTAFALPAGAANPAVVHSVADGTAGIEALYGGNLHSVGATLSPDPAAENIGGLGSGGIGVQLCDPNNGNANQIGEVSNGTTMTVDFAHGTLVPAAHGLVCESAGVFPAAKAHALNPNLENIPASDTIDVFVSFRNVRVHAGRHRSRWQGEADFQAFDVTAGVGPYSTGWVAEDADWNMDSAGAGVQQDTTLTSACTPIVTGLFSTDLSEAPTLAPESGAAYKDGTTAEGSGACIPVVEFDSAWVNGPNIFSPGAGLTASGVWNEVYTSAGGINANPALVATNGTLYPAVTSFAPSEFDIFAGNAVG